MRKIQPLKQLHPIQNSSGETLFVDDATLAELRGMFAAGDWGAILKDVDGRTHAVVIPDNVAILSPATDNLL